MADVEEILNREDAMSMAEANQIADAIDGVGLGKLHEWLEDIIECDGSDTESKLAAILRGLILRIGKE